MALTRFKVRTSASADLVEFVEVDFEGLFRPEQRVDIGAVASIPHRHLVKGAIGKIQPRLGPIKLEA